MFPFVNLEQICYQLYGANLTKMEVLVLFCSVYKQVACKYN